MGALLGVALIAAVAVKQRLRFLPHPHLESFAR